MSSVEAVIFDWGGTLSVWAEVDLEDMWRAAARHLDSGDGKILLARLIEVEERFWRRVETTQESAHLSELLAEAARDLNLDVTDAVLEEAAVHHLDAWTPHVRHDPDARAVLAGLKERGLKTGLLSNTMWPRHFHERFLERDGISEFLDERVYTSDLPHTKPHRAAFQAVLDALDVTDPGRAIFVGDRPFDDIHGAQAVGMRTVLRPGASVPGFGVEPDASIETLPELLDLVDEWS